jgi:hypothetical protein
MTGIPPSSRLPFRCHLLLVGATILIALALTLFLTRSHRTFFLIAEIFLNLLAVTALTAAMFDLDRPLQLPRAPNAPLFPRLALKFAKRIVLVLQLLTTALLLFSLYALLFHYKIPGT